METPYSGQTGRTTSEATTVWCGGCGIWFGSSVYRSIDAETDSSLVSSFLSEGFSALNTCVCPSCNWRHVAEEALAFHCPQRRQFFLLVPTAHRHRAQTIRADFLASVAAAPGAHVPRYVFEPVLVGSRTELKQLLGETSSSSRSGESDFSSLDIDDSYQEMFGDTPKGRSVVKRSQTLNLLAELVGEEPGQLEDAMDELEALGRGPASASSDDNGSGVDALTTQREFEASGELEVRHATAATGLLAAALDERSETQSIVMPDGVAKSSDAIHSQSDFEDDFESVESVQGERDRLLDDSTKEGDSIESKHAVLEESAPPESVETTTEGFEPAPVESPHEIDAEDSVLPAVDPLSEGTDDSLDVSDSSLDLSGSSQDGSSSSTGSSPELDSSVDDVADVSSVDVLEAARITDADASDVSDAEEMSSSVMQVDEVDFDDQSDEIDGNVTGEIDKLELAEPQSATEIGEPRQRLTTGSVELSADYSQELEEHSRPPMPREAEMLEGEDEQESPRHAIHVSETGVVLSSELSEDMMVRLTNRAVRVVPQLHVFDKGSVCTLTVMVDDETSGDLFWAHFGARFCC